MMISGFAPPAIAPAICASAPRRALIDPLPGDCSNKNGADISPTHAAGCRTCHRYLFFFRLDMGTFDLDRARADRDEHGQFHCLGCLAIIPASLLLERFAQGLPAQFCPDCEVIITNLQAGYRRGFRPLHTRRAESKGCA